MAVGSLVRIRNTPAPITTVMVIPVTVAEKLFCPAGKRLVPRKSPAATSPTSAPDMKPACNSSQRSLRRRFKNWNHAGQQSYQAGNSHPMKGVAGAEQAIDEKAGCIEGDHAGQKDLTRVRCQRVPLRIEMTAPPAKNATTPKAV